MNDFLTLADLPLADWPALFDRAASFSTQRSALTLEGMSVAVVMEKASTRTRVSFEVGVFELGGHAVVIQTEGSQIARGEPVEDTARVLASYCQAIVVRTFGQERLAAYARASNVPVINALTDQHHPCQVATDLFTVREHFKKLQGLRYAWFGVGNYMAQSWIDSAGMFGLDLVVACPDGYGPDAQLVNAARAQQKQTGGSITLTTKPEVAAEGAHVLNTDVWASMGQEAEAAKRKAAFAGYRIDQALLSRSEQDSIVLHCLPAHRGEEITGDVLDGPRSLAWVQAGNRLPIAKAILERVLSD